MHNHRVKHAPDSTGGRLITFRRCDGKDCQINFNALPIKIVTADNVPIRHGGNYFYLDDLRISAADGIVRFQIKPQCFDAERHLRMDAEELESKCAEFKEQGATRYIIGDTFATFENAWQSGLGILSRSAKKQGLTLSNQTDGE